MTMRDWMKDFGDAGETPSLVSLALFAVVFLPTIFLAGMVGPSLDMVREIIGGLSTEMKIAGITVFILGLMAIARILTLLFGGRDGDGS
ncbi:hypothetical protein Mmar10_0499 [Maricaulis maris MCS10]|uniref:Uncharacterized protein n=1 Tax=Maricaulis maris (strain MCS10) TaxID=394221 RepID=Q0ASE5_MARMM|nr:hypothetical protein [Maricaulis maris]ABI64792.1 hypothetical protein Mmar10_0499 [Maricaulis maris MCS10]